MSDKAKAAWTGKWTRAAQHATGPVRRWTAPIRRVVAETLRGFLADRGVDLAASLAFASLVAAVPLLATFSLLLATFFQQNVNEILDVVNTILPYHTARVTESLRDFIAEADTISGIGLLLLLVTSVRLIFIVEGVFNAVWGAPRRRGFVARTAVYSLVLVALALLVGAMTLGLRRLRRFGLEGPLAGTLFPFIIEFLALALLYRFLPNAKVRWTPALAAAAAVACGLEVLRSLFGLYVNALSRVNLITGSLTFVLLTLISVYLVWTLILFGVELTSVLQAQVAQRTSSAPPASPTESAVRMLVRMAGGAHLAQDIFDVDDPSAPEMEQVLGKLSAAELVTGSREQGYTLARSPQQISLARVVEALEPDLYGVAASNDRIARTLRALFQRLRGDRRRLLATTIGDLAQR